VPQLLQQSVDTFLCCQERYEKPRKAANTSMMAAMDTLRLLFSADAPLLAGARSLGLGALQSLPPVKNRIMQYAMGL
jgi:2-polyprenyl-6-methoxyphenol hydroxylase-like FAD-dependent oxidoreductase